MSISLEVLQAEVLGLPLAKRSRLTALLLVVKHDRRHPKHGEKR